MNFKDLLLQAKTGDDFAIIQIMGMYRPLLIKESVINGVFDEDLYQELQLIQLSCIRTIKVKTIV